MIFSFEEKKEIPKLSWCAIMEEYSKVVHLIHGSWVEVNGHFFVEGIWDYSFSEGLIDRSFILMGSGGRIDNGSIIFASPCHTLDRLHYIFKENKLYVSNSIAFVLAQAKLFPDFNYMHYISDFESIYAGIDRYIADIPLENGFLLHLAYYQNLIVNEYLNVQVEQKQLPPNFDSFASYKQFLTDSLTMLSKNANDESRRINYSALATISRGYDSTATAALAKMTGCTKTLTVAGPGKFVHDCGTDIAKMFGYDDIVELMVDAYKQDQQKMIEPLFMASGELGTDVFWASYEKHLPGTYVITGTNGDQVWEVNKRPSTTMKRPLYAAGTSLGEYRLRTGFIQVPVPFFGCINHPEIHRISISKEMASWRIGNDYDRPIPRRIVEEMGIERDQFGNRKIGIGFNVKWYPLFMIRKEMCQHSYKSFIKYYRENAGRRSIKKKIVQGLKFTLYASPIYINHFMLRIPGLQSFSVPYIFPGKFSDNPFASSYLFYWGLYHSIKQYLK